MEAIIEVNTWTLAAMLKVAHIQQQLRRWEREARKAARNYELCRLHTAEKRLEQLSAQYAELTRQIRKEEGVSRR